MQGKTARQGKAATTLRGFPATPTVYFVQAEQLRLIKIGVTVDLRDRIKTLQVGCPDKLELIGAIYDDDAPDIERRLHARLANSRSHGEWFFPSDEVLLEVQKHPVETARKAQKDQLRRALSATYSGRPLGT